MEARKGSKWVQNAQGSRLRRGEEGLSKTAWRSNLNCTMGMLEIPQIGDDDDDEVGAGAKSYRFNDQFDKNFLPQNSGVGVGGASDQQQEGNYRREGEYNQLPVQKSFLQTHPVKKQKTGLEENQQRRGNR